MCRLEKSPRSGTRVDRTNSIEEGTLIGMNFTARFTLGPFLIFQCKGSPSGPGSLQKTMIHLGLPLNQVIKTVIVAGRNLSMLCVVIVVNLLQNSRVWKHSRFLESDLRKILCQKNESNCCRFHPQGARITRVSRWYITISQLFYNPQ